MNLHFTRHIEKSEEKLYLEVPFDVPEGVERIDIRYDYIRFREERLDGQTASREVNIIDLAVISPNGYVGASGSNRGHIHIAASGSARGYASVEAVSGTWTIIAGAYHVEDGGVDVRYDIEFTPKRRQLLRGDLHCHSTASDGDHATDELMRDAARMGLDFLCVSDHNAFSQNDEMAAPPPGLTMLPGMELTHYGGHINFIGVKRPVGCPFPINGKEAMRRHIDEARANGAHVSVNHPFADCAWTFGLDMDMDTVEIWNGGIPAEHNMDALRWWHGELCKGRRLPIVGGSDYHSTEPGRTLACPATWVYADSREPSDILKALKAGRGFVTMDHKGPRIDISAGGAALGEVARGGETVRAVFTGLQRGDVVKYITDLGVEEIAAAAAMAQFTVERRAAGCKFARFEVWKPQYPSLASFPWLISNPVYFAK